MNNKAISDLVATVLLVLITIAAVGIIWGAIMPIIKSNIETAQKCSGAELIINTESGYTYKSGDVVFVQVSRGASTVDLRGIQLKVVNDKGNSNSTQFSDYPSANSDKVYNVTWMNATRVGVAPIIAVGNLNYTCPMAETSIPK